MVEEPLIKVNFLSVEERALSCVCVYAYNAPVSMCSLLHQPYPNDMHERHMPKQNGGPAF